MMHLDNQVHGSPVRRGLRFTAGALAVVGLASAVGGSAEAGRGHGRDSFHGRFSETAAGAAAPLGYDIRGTATMFVDDHGTTVSVRVVGLDPAKTYGSHLHNGSCASGGGGHYQNDDSEAGATTPPNELWLATHDAGLEPNRRGVARGNGSASWVARTESTTQTNALSVVVHEPDSGTRIACADLHRHGRHHRR